MGIFEWVEAVPYWETKELLKEQTSFLRKSTIHDRYFLNRDGDMARLRKQDTLTKLSCTKKGCLPPRTEAVFLDSGSVKDLLEIAGFDAAGEAHLTRDTWKIHQYQLHLDRVRDVGDFLLIETPAQYQSKAQFRKAVRRLIERLELPISPSPQLEAGRLDTSAILPYTRAINFAA